MALGIYSSTSVSTKLSINNSFTNPLSLTFDGRLGGTREIKLYIRNDDPLYRYEDIQVTSLDNSAEPIVNNPAKGYFWKLSAGDIQPTKEEWNNISPGNSITLGEIGEVAAPDTSTYLPFWLYIQIPPGTDVQVFDHVKLRLSANEVLI